MRWKRVTSELHYSYFRLMTIKHAILKIEWAIEWALNYYITQSRQEVRQLELERRCGRENHARPKGPLEPLMSWGPEKLLIRCGRESYSRPKGSSGPPVVSETCWWQDVAEKASTQEKAEPLGFRLSSPGEQERHKTNGHKSGGQNIAVLFGLQHPHTIKPHTTLSNLANKVRGTYFLKKPLLILYPFVVVNYCAWICIWVYNKSKVSTKLNLISCGCIRLSIT